MARRSWSKPFPGGFVVWVKEEQRRSDSRNFSGEQAAVRRKPDAACCFHDHCLRRNRMKQGQKNQNSLLIPLFLSCLISFFYVLQ